MMSTSVLRVETTPPLVRLILDRPEVHNAFDDELVAALDSALERLAADADAADPAVRAVVLAGAGRSFCAGFDFGDNLASWGQELESEGRWDPGKDMIYNTSTFTAPVPKFMSLCGSSSWIPGRISCPTARSP